MKIEFEISRRRAEIREMTKVAISNRLYVNGWTLRKVYSTPELISLMVLAKFQGQYIGVACTTKARMRYRGCLGTPNIGIFVRKKFRKKGVGSAMFNLIRSIEKRRLHTDGNKFYRNKPLEKTQ